MKKSIKIGALISGGGTNLQAVVDACEKGHINGEIVFVGSDKEGVGGLERANKHNIPSFIVDYRSIMANYHDKAQRLEPPQDFDLKDILQKQRLFGSGADPEKVEAFFTTRAVAEKQLLERMEPYSVDLLILAGFMRNLSPYFIDRFNTHWEKPKIMNIHPALLPAFPGIDGYGDTFRYGCKVGGCTVHFIDYGEDSGPIIGQKAFSISDDDDLGTIRKKGLDLEWQLYPECIQLFAQGRLQVVTMTHTLSNGTVAQKKIVKIAKLLGK